MLRTSDHHAVTCSHAQSHAVTRSHMQSRAVTRNGVISFAVSCHPFLRRLLATRNSPSTTDTLHFHSRQAHVVPTAGAGMGTRALSGQDLPLCTEHLKRLEYY